MPKLKTHKGAAHRFHVTGSGLIMRTKGGKSHLRRKKTNRSKRLFDEMVPVAAADVASLKRLLPYGVK
ncbi:MAG: 50S ribosomal protein L35 [Dehalococcoidia bacterium]|nr:50S ribosomal protein L35 [Dehalococcoidia bacterium]